MSGDTETWDDLVDLATLSRWMSDLGFGDGAIEQPRLLTGGTQNVLLRFGHRGHDYVLRRGPRHPRAHTDRTLLREMRVLQALAGSAVPHAGLIAGCDDPAVLGNSVFYLMEPIDALSPMVGVPATFDRDRTLAARVGPSIASALAELGELDPSEAGLADLGNAEGFLERQIPRWSREFAGYGRYEGWSASALDGLDELAAWLDARTPPPAPPGLMHGDSSLANVMVDDGGQVAAIVDWEMVTVGDPLLDLGWLVASWPGINGEDMLDSALGSWAAATGTDLGGRDEIVAAYAARSTRDLTHLDWYVVMACYKLAIILEGTQARACAGLAPADTGRRLHHIAVALVRSARSVIADAGREGSRR